MSLVDRVDAAIDAALVDLIVGCVVLVHQGGKEIYARAAGLADRENKLALKRDAIFRLASVTKPIVATCILRMVEMGLLSLDDPITKFLPWFTPPGPDGKIAPISIHQLLTHTSGIIYAVPSNVSPGLSGPIVTLEENLRRLARVPLAFAPGTGWTYGMGIDVLGGLVAAINGSTLETAIRKYVGEPLGMKDAAFRVTDPKRLAVPYADGRPPKTMREPEFVNDDSGGAVQFSPARIFNADAPQSGGAGMAGTADDVMKLLASYVATNPILKRQTVDMALSNQIGEIDRGPNEAGKGFGYIGAVTKNRALANTPCPDGAVDWGGAWGHNWIVDPVNQLAVLTCTNVAFEGCNGKFREDIRDAIYK